MLNIRWAELVGLGSTALAFCLTALLAGTGYAVESNPVAVGMLDSIGWLGAGVAALSIEALIFEGYRRLARRAPRGASAGAWLVASIGLADVAVNLWVLATVGIPPSLSRRLVGAMVVVSLVAVALACREVIVREVRLLDLPRLRPRRPSRDAVVRSLAVVAISAGVVLAGIGPVAGPLSYSENASAAEPSDVVHVFSDANNNVKYIDSSGAIQDTGRSGGGVGAADLDDDGSLGFIYVDGSSNLIYFEDGNATDLGVDATESGGISDWDNDDLYEVAYRDSTDINLVDINGQVNDLGITGYDVGGFGDFDGDGDTDLTYRSTDTATLEFIDTGGENTDTGVAINEVGETADYDGDGTMEVAGRDESGGVNNLVFYQSDGSTFDSGAQVSDPGDAGDFDGDGDIDVLLADPSDNIVYSDYNGNTVDTTASGNDVGHLVTEPVGGASSGGDTSGYSQTYILDDRTGLFPSDRSTLTLYEWDPGAKSLDRPSESEEWSTLSIEKFNTEDEAYVELVDGDYYKLEVLGPKGDTWEVVGFQANDSSTRQTLVIKDFGGEVTPTPTPGGTPTPTLGPNETRTPTPTPVSGSGPTSIGMCEVPGYDDPGLEIEYWDPDYETSEFNYHLEGPENGTIYSGTKVFDESIGYWRGCVAPPTLNDTDPDDVGGTYNGTDGDGAFNGSFDWPTSGSSGGGGFLGGPTGSGDSSGATRWGGLLILVGGGYAIYRRFDVNLGESVSSLLGRS